MEKSKAQELLAGEVKRTVEFMRSGGQLVRVYTVHRPEKPPVPTTIPGLPTESMQNIRSLIRCISDVLTGDAVSVVIPVTISPPGLPKKEAVIAAINWRSGQNVNEGGVFARVLELVRESNGNFKGVISINPPDVNNFLNYVLEGVLSPVVPDISSKAYARHRLISIGFTPDMLSEDPALEDMPVPTIH